MGKRILVYFSAIFLTIFLAGCQMDGEVLTDFFGAIEDHSVEVDNTYQEESGESEESEISELIETSGESEISELTETSGESEISELTETSGESEIQELAEALEELEVSEELEALEALEALEETPNEDTIDNNSDADPTIDEDGHYTKKEDVALYIHIYNKLPSNYITKKEAQEQGWNNSKNTMAEALPNMSIGGDRFGNYEGLLPKKDGRNYKECDIDYVSGGRNAKRIVYSNDGLIFYTNDHYSSFEQLY